MVDNIIIGKPLVDVNSLIEKEEINHFTEKRFLPEILKDLKLVPSISWVRKNKPNLVKELNDIDCITIRVSKKKKPIFIIIGE